MPRGEEQPGEIAILSTACAFAPAPGEPLVRLMGNLGKPATGNLRWTGQGSLAAPGVPIVTWLGPDGHGETVDESSLSIAGLVRSEVGFAGAASRDAAMSRIVRWQAPLQSANPPGIDPALLPSPSP
jgi:hypothetical protein